MPRPVLPLVGMILAAAALVLAACDGGDDDASPATSGPASSTTPATASSPEPDDEGEAPTTSSGAEAPATTAAPAGDEPVPVAFDGVELETTACRFAIPAGQEPACYWLTVPQAWDDPDEADGLRLHVAVFAGAMPDAEPVVYLEGGPGRGGLGGLADSFDRTLAPLLARGDVVVFDQRGTGLSEPALECPELADLNRTLASPVTPVSADATGSIAEATAECRERLVGAGIELDAYNSLASAADADALRDALGVDRWNVYGARYGTRLAQTYVREHAPTIRSAVLDAAYGIDADPLDASASGQAAITRLFDDCAADTGCAERFGDLGQRFEALRQRLDAEPLTFTSTDLGSGAVELEADGQYLYDTVSGALRSRELLATVPRLIEQVENGGSTIIGVLAALDVARQDAISLGQHLSVLCNEEAPFSDGTLDALYASACPAWDAGSAPAIEDEALTSDVPTLILASEFDAASPSSDSARVGDGLTTSHFVEFAGIGGSALGHDCPDAVIIAFLDDPASPPDTACVADMARPVYVTGDIGTIALEDAEVDFFGARVSTVRPTGWDLVQRAGGFTRMRDVLDPTGIFTLAVPEVPVTDVAAQLAERSDFELIAAPSLDLGCRTWQRFDGASADDTLTMAGTIEDGTTIIVLLEALPDERDALVDEVLLPVLEAVDVTVE